MHLVLNAVDIGRQRGGNESYLVGLLQGFQELEEIPKITLLLTSSGVAALPPEARRSFDVFNIGRYHQLYFHFLQQTLVLRRLNPDWYLSTFFLPPLAPCRMAVFIHDLSFRSHPEYFPWTIALYMRIMTQSAIRRADRVIALSKFTQREILRYHPRVRDKTTVIYPGVKREFNAMQSSRDVQVLRSYGLASGYILAIGNIHPRKNLRVLLDAYVQLRARGEMLPAMVWVGQQCWDSERLVQQARAAGVLMLGFVAEEDLPAVYRHAALLVYPSLYEGFGLPPVEAMACGTPVIVSNTASLPEAVGDAGVLVTPHDVEALSMAIKELLGKTDQYQQLQRVVQTQVQKFTWKRTATDLLASLWNHHSDVYG